MILLALQEYLASKLEITNRIKSYGGKPSIFRNRRPQETALPAIVLSTVGRNPDYHLRGEIGDLGVLVQCSVYADTYVDAQEIAELVRLAPLSGFAGQWPTQPGDETTNIEVKAVTIRSEIDDEIERSDSSDLPIFRSTKDYQIHYERAVVSAFA